MVKLILKNNSTKTLISFNFYRIDKFKFFFFFLIKRKGVIEILNKGEGQGGRLHDRHARADTWYRELQHVPLRRVDTKFLLPCVQGICVGNRLHLLLPHAFHRFIPRLTLKRVGLFQVWFFFSFLFSFFLVLCPPLQF